MISNPLKYHLVWNLEADTESIWYHISNTNRFNHDLGLPALSDPLDPGTIFY